jgi:hypothetical protein
MKHDTTSAIAILEAALEKGSTFREADSLLVFEVRTIGYIIFYRH